MMHKRKRSASATLHRVLGAVPGYHNSTGSSIGGSPPVQVQGALLVEDCIKWLETHKGVEEEGIFRISGEKLTVDAMAVRYAKGEKLNLEQMCEGRHHDVAGLLKQFLRELKDPLLSFDLYDTWINAYRAPSEEQQIQELQAVIETLPNWNRSILKRLMGYAHEVTLHSQVNKMESNNLAIVFAPTLLRARTDDAMSVLNDDRRGVVQFMIDRYNVLFMETGAAEDQPQGSLLLQQELERIRDKVTKQQQLLAEELAAEKLDLEKTEEMLNALHKRIEEIDKQQQTVDEYLSQLSEMESQVYSCFIQFNHM